MTIRDVLIDVTKKIGGLGSIDMIKVTGTDDATTLEAVDAEKSVIIKTTLKTPEAEFKGEFGITNLPLLNGLLNFASYKSDDATFSISQRDVNGKTAPEEFVFRDAKNQGANFRLMAGNVTPDQPVFAPVTWDAEVTIDKSNLQEFSSLASLYSSVDPFFAPKIKDGKLVAFFGSEGSATHRASVVLAEGVSGEIKSELLWPISQFLSIMKMADGTNHTLKITHRGAMEIAIENDVATYRFIMPARRR